MSRLNFQNDVFSVLVFLYLKNNNNIYIYKYKIIIIKADTGYRFLGGFNGFVVMDG